MDKSWIITKSPQETKNSAKFLFQEWLKKNKTGNSNCLVFFLGLVLGGKPSFMQGLAEELGVKKIVNSPTFLVMKKYDSLKYKNKKYNLYHFDCYRMSNYKEILDLGWEEIISEKNNIIVIEWSEKIEKVLPNKRLEIKFEFIDEKTRKIIWKF